MIGFYATLLLLLLGLVGAAALLVRCLRPLVQKEYRRAQRRADALEQVELEEEAGYSVAREELLGEEPQHIGRQGNR